MEQESQQILKRTLPVKGNCILSILVLIILLTGTMTVLGQLPSQTRFTVVIDAGHGGKDPGAIGKKSFEKNIALAIAKKTGYYIEKLMPDVKVIYTRKTDVFVDLDVRASIANKADADLFMSIHVDGFGTQNAYGTSSFVMGATKNENNLALARKENKVIELEKDHTEKYKAYDPNDPTIEIALRAQQHAYGKQSLGMAARVQDQFRTKANRRDRGVHSAPLLVLWQTTMPSVLIETGFITNPKEEQFLNTDYGQDLMASSIYEAFKAYKDDIEKKTASSSSLISGTNAQKVDLGKDNIANETRSINLTKILQGSDQMSAKTESKTKIISDSQKETEAKSGNNSMLGGVRYRVQIMASKNRIPLNHKSFKGQSGLEEIREDPYYKYVSKELSSFQEAKTLQKQLARNFSGAFIVAYINGVKTSVSEARNMEKQLKTPLP